MAAPPPVRGSAAGAVRPVSRQVMVTTLDGATPARRPDQLAVEAPLEVRVQAPDGSAVLGVTMRTPGADAELVAGMLLAEHIIAVPDDLWRVSACGSPPPTTAAAEPYAVATAVLRCARRRPVVPRATVTSSACGVCGTPSLDGLDLAPPPVAPGPTVDPAWLCSLPDLLRAEQQTFAATGSVHAAGLALPEQPLAVVREDVGRHNAVDKVIGWALLQRRLPWGGALVVSGRVSYEIVQKAVCAGIPLVVAVSGATDLAVTLAKAAELTLVGFVRGRRATVYCGAERIGGGALRPRSTSPGDGGRPAPPSTARGAAGSRR